MYFDLDGTLTTYGEDFRELFDRVVPEELSDEVYDVYVSEVLENLEEKVDEPYLKAFQEIKEQFDLNFDAEQVAEKYIQIEVGSTKVHKNMRELLENLSKKHKIGILTNGDSRVQRMKIEENNLEELVDEIIISNDLGVRKPDPEIFEEAKKRLPAENYVFVGDTFDEDIKPAQEAGFRTIYINGEREADIETRSPEKIGELLTILLDI
ncbi:MAG: HAD family hydrolase [Candidatus Nanohaloarchaea archaeon]